MKVIHNIHDLREFGIIYLTGEACGYGYRGLCDVTEQGKVILEKTLDAQLILAPPWNGSSNGVGCIMLSPGMWVNLAVVALLQYHDWVLVEANGCCYGCSEAEYQEVLDSMLTIQKNGITQYRRHGDAAGGARNMHRMTQRVY